MIYFGILHTHMNPILSQLIIDYTLEKKIVETRFDNVSYLSNEWIIECFSESATTLLLLKECAHN